MTRPSALLMLLEPFRAMGELGALMLSGPLLARAPRGDGHPVLVLPGFIASDASTWPLRLFLRSLGYEAHAWELGRNLGWRTTGPESRHLLERIRTLHDHHGQRVSLIGWSLGGVMARQASRRMPEQVRQVITLGSPFTGDPRATTVAGLYERVTGDRLDGAFIRALLREGSMPPPVPATAIYSETDGIVSWRNCVEPSGPTSENIVVRGSHAGLPVNPAVLHAIADRLALADGAWRRFGREGWRQAVYPPPAVPGDGPWRTARKGTLL